MAHREREPVAAPEPRRDVEVRCVGEPARTERVEGDAQVDRVVAGAGAPRVGRSGSARREPAVDGDVAPLAQEREHRVERARAGPRHVRDLRRARERHAEPAQVAPKGCGPGPELARHDADALGLDPLVEECARSRGDGARLGVGAGRLAQPDLRRGSRGLARPLARAGEGEPPPQPLGEADAEVGARRVGRVRRVVDERERPALAHEGVEERARGARRVGEAVHDDGAGREELGPRIEELRRAGEGRRAVGEAEALERAERARGDADEGLGARPGAGRHRRRGEGVEHGLAVDGLEARVEEVRHRARDRGVALAQRVELGAERRLPPRLAADEDGEDLLGPRELLAGALEQLGCEAPERLHREAGGAAAERAREPRRHVLAQAPRRHDHADRLGEERRERPGRGPRRRRAAERLHRPAHRGDERSLRRARARVDGDGRAKSAARRGERPRPRLAHRPQSTRPP